MKKSSIFTGATKRFLLVMLFAVLMPPMYSSWYTIAPEEAGLVLRFGKFVSQTKPGLHFKLPYPFERVTKIPTKRQLKEEFGFRTLKAGKDTVYDEKNDYTSESLMLTGDLNIAEVEWIAQYRITNPYKWLFSIRNPKETFRDLNEEVLRKVVGDKTVTEVLTVGRREIASQAKADLQKLCNKYSIGVTIDQVVLQDVNPPEPVKPSFNEVNQAQQEKKQLINAALAEYNKVIPRARGLAKRTIEEAKGFATERINTAKGDVVFFKKLEEVYSKNPKVTEERLYLENVQKILPGKQITIIDASVDNILPMLRLENK